MKKNKNFFFRINRNIDKEMFFRFKAFLKKVEDSGSKHAFILFNTNGGKTFYASKMVNLMLKSKVMVYGVASGDVNSAAIKIFLSTKARFLQNELNPRALIHRAIKEDKNTSQESIEIEEKQSFGLIAKKLEISTEEVFKMADENTILTRRHPLGEKFFQGIN